MTRRIGFFVFPGFQILDLAGPLAAFQVPGRYEYGKPYRLVTVSAEGGLVESSAGLPVMTEPVDAHAYDTLLVSGGRQCVPPNSVADIATVIREQAEHTRRIGSACTGAFVLAEAGLLDGRSATTHWRHAAALQRLYPKVKVNGDRIYTHDGPVWTSAGITAGIDLALALIEDDMGTDMSRAVARELVVYHRRPGGQSQFSTLLELDPDSDRIRDALVYAREHLHEKLSVDRLAEVACLSPRQFGRVFLAETGETPAKAVERMRAETARARIETGNEPIEAVARSVGFTDPERMRRAFIRLFGQPPQGIRRAARAA